MKRNSFYMTPSLCTHMHLSARWFSPASIWDSSHNCAVNISTFEWVCTPDKSKFQHSWVKQFASRQKGQSAGTEAWFLSAAETVRFFFLSPLVTNRRPLFQLSMNHTHACTSTQCDRTEWALSGTPSADPRRALPQDAWVMHKSAQLA